ncbi:Paired amphipathic helix protein Sin3a [Pyrenophora tritici-repentis]|uniref:Paired amphipathic helix protein Sin3a n=1 Tax=Pyrenophora tritici-repentis TaxID=45151 RepID=A0A922SWV6_9PLEO|nr:Paired amphipathic helix protein Sin3a [Pyrenophora tritici-repentis]KAI1664234.1 Paired amphipathic helix protein Sin3a [Pyrenophora tritici-repentis]KAI1678323.1 Paired amphipathic helix protein Sin3a [Pyrenophora tritici-repentis]
MGAVMDDEALELHFSPAFDWIQADFECDNRPNNSNPQGPHASSAQPSGPVLPQPSGGGYYASGAATAHNQNLPALPGLTAQPQHSSPHMSAQRPPSSDAGAQGHQAPPGPPYSLPGISQTLQQQHQQQQQQQQQHMPTSEQANADREREMRERETREREMDSHVMHQQEDHVKREAEQRDREHHERQQREHAALQSHSTPMQIHQPVAVAPSTRTIHGPNGLLGQSGPMNGPNLLAPPMGGPNATGQMYGNSASVQHEQTTPRMQHAVQAPTQAQMLMPFAGPPGSMAMGQGQQPILNDALSYLDQVKVQFADHPDVYNRFLDIMKDFKSGAIDTPGVIERVSTLFAGNPALIQGFNTFLPPGYKIECGTNGDPNAIRVTTPMGTMVSTMPAPRPLSPPRSAVNGNNGPQHESTYYETAQGQPWPQQQRAQAEGQESMFSPNNRTLGQPLYGQQQQQGPAPHSPEVTSRPHPDPAGSAAVLAHQQEQRGVSQLQNAVSAATGRSIMSPSVDAGTPLQGQALNGAVQLPQMGGAAAEKRGPVEFNHAISYVNKIKNRFAAHPDIYKNFLEILQTYQRESKPIQDVYAQVTHLFGGAPDLLEDFKQFLPESAAHHRAQQQAAKNAAEDAIMLSNVRGESGYGAVANQQTPGRADTSRLPPMGNFAPTPTANRDNKRKRERQGPVAAPMPTPMSQELPTSNLRGGYTQGSVNKRAKTGHAAKQAVPDGPPVSPTLTPALPEPMPPTTTTTPSQDELAFFDRVKKFIGNKNTMNEFLKLCNLYSQDLIDKSLLLYRAQSFIGGNVELFTWFKKFMGEDEEQQKSRPKTVNSRVSLSNCRSLGPSYRLLPKRERERVCSGRDELCRSVLNDEWASHPTWASEDSGFVAHRKNTFEEGLHRIEEERHDYDFNIEACSRTIQQLEPIANQLLAMKPEDRIGFTLPPGLGGQSETIYKRVIMKIYGRERGRDVIKELFAMPWSVVPVLLHRLKTKLEDWKAAQREWEKVWRDQTQKIFWKSLDHQSITVKQADKRQFQPKSLTNEIQVRYEEQKRLQQIQEIPQEDYQFAFSFKDEEVLFDVARLMLTFADNNTGADFAKVVPFIKEFVPLFFGIDAAKFEQRVHTSGRDTPNDSGEDTPSPDEDVSQRSQKSKKGDLRRDVLDPRGKSRKDKDDSAPSASRDSTPDTSGMEDEAAGDSSNSNPRGDRPPTHWVEYATTPTAFGEKEFDHDEPYRRVEYNMYANASIYCFFRMFVMLYERLWKLKDKEEEVRKAIMRAKEPKAAHKLKMLDKQPEDFFKDTSPSANYYQQVLDMFQDQITGDVDMNFIEETLRRYYLQTGWQLYSFDRLLSSLVRFALAVVSHDNKDKSLDIYNLFKKDRVNDTTTHKNEISYRKAVEKYAKDTDTYRITYDPAKMEAHVRLFKKDDPTFEFNTLDRVKRWRAYIASFTAIEPTEEVDASRVRYPYLKRRLAKNVDLSEEERFEQVRHCDTITISISPSAYILGFVNSEPFGNGGVQYYVQPDAVRAGLSEAVPNPTEEYKKLNDERRERVQEILVRNNSWMKDLSRDDVDAKKTAFKKDIEEPRKVTGEDDVDMEGADGFGY